MNKHDRQSFLGPHSEVLLRSLRVGIIGLGGGGSHISQQLAHVGIGNIYLFDFDTIDAEGTNLNRLIGGTEKDVDSENLKVHIAERLINGVDSKITVMPIPASWQDHISTIRELDFLFGCVDSLAQRRDVESFARRFQIPYIDIGMDVHENGSHFSVSGQVFLSLTGQPCMSCLGVISQNQIADEAAKYGAAGSRPQVVWSNGVLASAAVGMFMECVTPWAERHPLNLLLEYDGNAQTLKPSEKLEYLSSIACSHFGGASELGDPFTE